MSQINIKNLSFSYDGSYVNIFDNVNINLDTTWRLGLIGRNGRGKTTLLNLLMNKYQFSGEIISSVQFDYFPYDVQDKSKLTIDVIEEIFPNYELWKIIINMGHLKVNEECLYRAFNTLSNGEQIKILLAVLFAKENNFLLIDEPTNHLDYEARIIVANFLKMQNGYILVSHDRNFMDTCVDHILAINKNNIVIEKGNFTTWWSNKKNNDIMEMSENEKLKKEIERLKMGSQQAKVWANAVEKTKNGVRVGGLRVDRGFVGHKSAKMMKRSKVIENRQNKMIEEKSKLLKNVEKNDDLFVNSQNINEKFMLELKDVAVYYNNKKICKEITFTVEPGEKISLTGENGSGKSSLLKLIMGENISYCGDILRNKNLKISYIGQDTSLLLSNEIVLDFAKINNINTTKFLTMLIKLGFTRDIFEVKISNLSEGQKKKLLIAKSLCEDANLYVWDEPLNYIDVFSRMQIEELLLKEKITLICVEHDAIFVKNVANKIITIEKN